MEGQRNRMEKLIFEPKRIKIVDIDLVRPNTWNPKDKNTEEYQTIKEGIRLKGLRFPIVVRENDGYEIIDGEQRWRACKELGYKRILIYNEEKISDKEARELTLWYEQRVPFNEVSLAKLVSFMDENYSDLEVPFPREEIDEMKELVKFDWDEFKRIKDSELPDIQMQVISVTAEQYKIITQAIGELREKGNTKDISEGRALELICADFLAGK